MVEREMRGHLPDVEGLGIPSPLYEPPTNMAFHKPPATADRAPEGLSGGSLALVCPYCGATLSIILETVGPAYLTYERPESIECYANDCGATWEPNGEPRDAPQWERYPSLYKAPQRASQRADRAARLAEQGAVIARVEALAKLAGEAIARIGGSHTHWREGGAGGTCQTCENANRTREEFALRLAAALRPDPSAQGAGAEGVGT